MRDIGALRIASRAPTQSIAAAEQALQKRTAMEPRTRHDHQSGTDAISSRTDASSLPRSAWSPPASLLLKFDVQTRGRTRTARPNEHQANEHPPFVGAPGTSSIVRCSRTRRQHLPLTISRGNCQWVLVVLASAQLRRAGRCESLSLPSTPQEDTVHDA